MKVLNSGTVPVYTVSGASGLALPEWISKKRQNRKGSAEQASRVELLQDFEFEGHSACIRISEDGNYIMSTGAYKPQIHVHDLRNLSLSFARHTESLNHSFVLVSPDYSKSIHLQTDRRIQFHTPNGCHYQARIPRFGRDILYDRRSTEVLVPSVGLDADGSGEVFRLNLELGQFMRSYSVNVGSDEGVERGLQGSIGVGCVNAGTVAEDSHGLLSFGTSLGTVEFWDPRSKSRVATLQSNDGGITALCFSQNGLSLATGSSTGLVRLYDLRRPSPLLTKDQGFGYHIKKLVHVTTASEEKLILSADQRIIRLFDEITGEGFAAIEPEVELHDVVWYKNSGMLFSANEGKHQHAWFIPALGKAPAFCSFLDNISEEMAEEVSTETYDNYKFLTLPELKSLSLAHLVGKTNLLRPYMHGYFVASKLYDQARLIANPYVWEDERVKRIKEKVEKERASRIRGSKKVKINQKQVDALAAISGDSRFRSLLLGDEEFLVDEEGRDSRALNASTQFGGADSKPGNSGRRTASSYADGDDDSNDDSDSHGALRKRGDDVVMRVSSSSQTGGSRSKDTALGSRTQRSGRIGKIRRGDAVGERQVTFVPESKKSNKQPPNAKPKGAGVRRSASTNTFRRL